MKFLLMDRPLCKRLVVEEVWIIYKKNCKGFIISVAFWPESDPNHDHHDDHEEEVSQCAGQFKQGATDCCKLFINALLAMSAVGRTSNRS